MEICGEIAYIGKEGRRMTIKIYLIEDCVEEAKELLEKLREIAQEKNTHEINFEFQHLRGTQEGTVENKTYLFYEENIVRELDRIYNNETTENVKIGILLDMMLTEADVRSRYAHYYPEAAIAKKIYFGLNKKMPIYLISSYPEFATQCEVIMGEDLSDKFITKNAVLRYNIQADIDKMFKFFEK